MTIPSSSSPPRSAHLDAEIHRIRTEIAKLRSQKKQLSSALLGSSRIQKYIHDHQKPRQARTDSDNMLQEKLDEAVEVQRRENDVRIHRLAIGVTAFPFNDPAPERTGEHAMLGVRFDLAPFSVPGSGRGGKLGGIHDQTDTWQGALNALHNGEQQQQRERETDTENTFFVMLRRLQYQGRTYLKVHHHTIPGHIDVEYYADQYLPLPDALREDEDGRMYLGDADTERSGIFEDDSGIDLTQDIQVNSGGTNTTTQTTGTQGTSRPPTTLTTIEGNNQDLHEFTRRLRDDLQSFHNRIKSITYLRHQLNLETSHKAIDTGASPRSSVVPDLDTPSEAKHGVTTLSQTTHDARQIKIIWADSTLGILRLAYDGTVDRAVVYGTKHATQTSSASDTDSELSELESDDDRNIVRTQGHATAQPQADREEANARKNGPTADTSNVRRHDVERLLMVNEDGSRVMVHDLVDRLRVVDQKVFSA